MHSVEDVLRNLREASRMMQDVRIEQDDKEESMAALASIIEMCGDMERAATRHHVDLRRESRTERQMTNYIVVELETGRVKTKASDKEIAAGGMKAAALRKADGRCELCSAEWGLSCHHIIARAAGGLNDGENIIVMCKTCHDEIEPLGLQTREAVLRYDRTRDRGRVAQDDKSKSEKAATTKALNLAEDRKEAAEVASWAARWEYAGVPIYMLGDPIPERPEKLWHVLVYGAGKGYFESHGKR